MNNMNISGEKVFEAMQAVVSVFRGEDGFCLSPEDKKKQEFIYNVGFEMGNNFIAKKYNIDTDS